MPDSGRALRFLPLLMGEALAAKVIGITRRDFRAAVAAGVFPLGKVLVPGGPLLWHRLELQAVAALIWGLDASLPAEHDAAGRQAAEDALHGFTPPTGRARPVRPPALRPGRPQA